MYNFVQFTKRTNIINQVLEMLNKLTLMHFFRSERVGLSEKMHYVFAKIDDYY